MSDNNAQGSVLPLSGLVFLMTLLGGSLFLEAPFLSLRSPSGADQALREDALEGMNARLWQDPLSLAYRLSKETSDAVPPSASVAGGGEDPPELVQLARQVHQYLTDAETVYAFRTGRPPSEPFLLPNQDADAGDPEPTRLLLLPVMVPGGIYAEDGETRRRVRYAVIGGLAREGYVPRRSEHIGTFPFQFPPPMVRFHNVRVPVPFEWFVWNGEAAPCDFGRSASPAAAADLEAAWAATGRTKAARVLVLWLSEDVFAGKQQLAVLLQHLLGFRFLKDYADPPAASVRAPVPAPATRLYLPDVEAPADPFDGRLDITLLGPYSSDTLRAHLHTKGFAELGKRAPPPESGSPEQAAAHLTARLSTYVAGYAPAPSDAVGTYLAHWLAQQNHGRTIHDLVAELDLLLGKTLGGAGYTAQLNQWAADHAGYLEGRLFPAGLKLPPIRTLSFYATASWRMLLPPTRAGHPTGESAPDPARDARLLHDAWHDPPFTGYASLIARDDALAEALITELLLRGDHLARARALVHTLGQGAEAAPLPTNQLGGELVLVGEWDTFYARSLSASVKQAAQARLGLTPDQIIEVGYLRGLDGVIPGKQDTAGKAEPASRAGLAEGSAGSRKADQEQAVGRGQLDYVRRLSARLAADSKRRGDKIRAIGILGSDLYDKQLILQALRPRFPKAMFFTTDLDARMLHPSQFSWTRNLIVASGYGLSVDKNLQSGMPPFRDGYQSAGYLATRLAVRGWDGTVPFAPPAPVVFEIGRGEAVRLPRSGEPLGLHPAPREVPMTHFLETKGKHLVPFVAILLLWAAVGRVRHWWDTTVAVTRGLQLHSSGRYKRLGEAMRTSPFRVKGDLFVRAVAHRFSSGLSRVLRWVAWPLALGVLLVFWAVNSRGPYLVVVPLCWLFMAAGWVRACRKAQVDTAPVSWRRAAGTVGLFGLCLVGLWWLFTWPALHALGLLATGGLLFWRMPRARRYPGEMLDVLYLVGMALGSLYALVIGFRCGGVYPWFTVTVLVCLVSVYAGTPRPVRPLVGAVGQVSLVLLLTAVMDHRVGEPFSWILGVSTWPTVLLSWCIILAGIWCAAVGRRQLAHNARDIAVRFELEHPPEEAEGAGGLWTAYSARSHVVSSLAWTLLLLGGITLFVFSEGAVKPTRGAVNYIVDGVLFAGTGLVLVYLVIFAVEHTRAALRFIRALALDEAVHWHDAARTRMSTELAAMEDIHVSGARLDDYLDLKLITARTGVVANLIVFPFMIVFLDLLAHNTYFDHWSRPFFVYFFLGFLACLCLGCGLHLRRCCEAARVGALAQMRARIAAETDPEQRAGMLRLYDKMAGLKEGALAPWRRHPILKAVLWPLGGLSTLAMGEYFMWLFQ